jgi:hypothetical protein
MALGETGTTALPGGSTSQGQDIVPAAWPGQEPRKRRMQHRRARIGRLTMHTSLETKTFTRARLPFGPAPGKP